MISITSTLSIPESEISFITSRSSGPGGQHVNKTSSKVTLIFDLQGSTSLTDHQKSLIRASLLRRINAKGELLLSCEEHRSQFRNKESVILKFSLLLAQALKPRKKRRKTAVPRAAKRKRIEGKKKRSEIKKSRGRPDY